MLSRGERQPDHDRRPRPELSVQQVTVMSRTMPTLVIAEEGVGRSSAAQRTNSSSRFDIFGAQATASCRAAAEAQGHPHVKQRSADVPQPFPRNGTVAPPGHAPAGKTRPNRHRIENREPAGHVPARPAAPPRGDPPRSSPALGCASFMGTTRRSSEAMMPSLEAQSRACAQCSDSRGAAA
jgi:hypothetical protein